ncbi:type I restriction endonuclease subunit R [Hymenobacter lapidiphilus]|uniref:Type I restriction enzyme endonuclease subunit n=1 Tax=Hymenobacter lapidiphilus TaxID=2608003 RepID=A0A7Y7PKZ2_9BACT|nr:HsdR family type I site-specific deoxyribonuclease [Hymenobacter lapidiphilus]NVO29711.1 type I restriction endonuclease subunit R [Hymenobacter lapidiphilus]
MAFITEDDIERACVQVLMKELGYDEHLNLHHKTETDANKLFGRADTRGVVRLDQLAASLRKLNPHAPEAILHDALKLLTEPRPGMNRFEANRAVTQLLQKGQDLPGAKNAKGEAVLTRVRYVDFEHPANNHFAVVQQLTIRGKATRRPDLLVFVNGLPLVFVELKNAVEDTRQAYDKNLTDYRRDIGQLFDYNLVAVLSNAYVTKVGSHTADWEQFFNWEKIADENEAVVPQDETDIERVMRALFRKETLLDLLENFVLFYANRAKIVAKNHQYLGVNNAVAALAKRQELAGKLGVFWHTQGSGKSFSMALFIQKVRKRLRGGDNLKFVLVTDRDDLEDQLWKTFVRSGLLDEKQPARATSAAHLGQLVKAGAPIIFTLIQKFKNPTGKGGGLFPELTAQGEDYVILVDEAHRSQYKDLGDNMRRAFRGASYLAFTGTPLLDAVETTKEWFGGYVSQYNFQESVLDGSTVPLYYHNRVPQMQLQNDALNEEFAEIMADENLSDEQKERLTRKYANVVTVITDNDRLDTVAQDIVGHFPHRGYLGKGMVVSLDKPTAVKMYDKVVTSWKQRLKELQGQINSAAPNSPEWVALKRTQQWMKATEMAVVVSEEAEEEQKFDKLGLNIRPHRALMNKTWGDDHATIEDRFREPTSPLRLVFVCAKWLTGFDAPTVSTLYLDKPLQNHTLMQTIARANRVAVALDEAGAVATEATLMPIAKTNGLIVDYYGLMAGGRLEKALAKYAKDKNTEEGEKKDYPAEDFEALLGHLDASIGEAVKFLDKQGLSLAEVLDSKATFDKLSQLDDMADALSKTDELKKEFGVYQTAVTSFYQACKPDILTEELLKGGGPYLGRYRRTKDALEYVRRIMGRQTDDSGNFDGARAKADSLIDEAIVAQGGGKGYSINTSGQEINLSSIDLEKLQTRFQERPHKNLAITDMVAFLQDRTQQLLNRNVGRVDLAQKLHEIIQQYNTASSDVEAFFAALKDYLSKLQEEDKRSAAEGLSEEELEIFDLLFVGELKQAEKDRVKLAAQHLLAKLEDNATKKHVLTPDWHKNPQLQMKVRDMIGGVLDAELPEEGYTKPVFLEKRDAVYEHLLNQATLGARYWA